MKKHYNIIIAGAGGIAEAVALLLNEWSELTPTIFIGDRSLPKAQNVAQWIQEGSTKPSNIKAYHLPENGISDEMKAILQQGDIILDCLPGSQAPRIAQFAKDYELHYANLTEYVSETEKIITLAKGAKTAFILQTGLAPGYIDLLAHGLFLQFCKDYKVNTVDKLELKVGALTKHAVAPHFYGFTWSPVGVATEYLKDTIVLRNYIKTTLPSLSERATIIINGTAYEEDLTSGGAADLPDALIGKVNSLSYKTLRFPGHYAWVDKQISNFKNSNDLIKQLQQKMESVIPHIEDDQIVLYAAVEGKDEEGILRRREIVKQILPLKVGKNQLRAIQTTTAAPLAQAAQLLLEGNYSGILLQSQIDPFLFLNGKFITNVYGKF
ncbi:saccharopine dehydrogenase family protein [Flavobacterium granuli]|uniref:Saccharopine dehydrogenase, NADP-dependent n=1 Tax=Flavobacterium granuli TaxID=280093 RepID=A0A1M5Q1J7_9FLAO|nr:saccharopine dehydrogenase NADP-binding domain-containing protein [Flavobacterium granuli]PRZ22026.1 saccharopine dehydrogenase-like NADP-dependent oxidoreductase [Flavobacterium granuli]SHH07631.1 Saccharopine dehydrogenase, NADP-dependent [Flavobacterium granuli]